MDEKVSLESQQNLNQHSRSLDERTFGLIMKKCLGLHNANNAHMQGLFMKIDYMRQGKIAWEDFCTCMWLYRVQREREDIATRGKQTAFSLPAKIKPLAHREPVLRIRTISDSTIVTLREDGDGQYWSSELQIQKTKTSVFVYVNYFPSFSAVVSSSNDEASSVVIGCVKPSSNVEQMMKEITEGFGDGKAKKVQLNWLPNLRRRLPGHVTASHGEPVLCCSYRKKLRQVVSWSEGSNGGFQLVSSFNFGPITGGRDGCLKMWNFNNGQCLKILKRGGMCAECGSLLKSEAQITKLITTADGAVLYAADRSDFIYVYDIQNLSPDPGPPREFVLPGFARHRNTEPEGVVVIALDLWVAAVGKAKDTG
ncbi:hypothetical protein NHX12_009273, partial [Muraenolepis orangiensis]